MALINRILPRTVTLTLTEEEAGTLADILGLIGGNGERRWYAINVLTKLEQLGFRSDYRAPDKGGAIYFAGQKESGL